MSSNPRSTWDARGHRGTLGLARMVALVAAAAGIGLGGSVAAAQGSDAPVARTAGALPRFVPGPCPNTPSPIPALETASCGQLIVPENRRRPNGRTISLSVAIVRAQSTNPKPDPIVWLAGGPGDDSIIEIPIALAGDLNRDRDVIFMSQRGTFTAQPRLTCPVVDRVAGDTLDLPYNARATGRVWAEATRTCRRQLSARGVDLSAYNTIESVDDLEDLRRALGIDKWNLFGISYGTDFALTYMRLRPEGIRSVGIDGIFPPDLAGGVSAWTSAGEGINAVFRACAAQRRCRERYGNIGATFRRLVRQFELSPETISVRVPGVSDQVRVTISGGMLLQWTVSPGTHFAWQVPAAIDALAHGDPDRIAVPWAQAKLDPAGIGVLSNGLFYGVSCREWVPYESEASVIASGRRAFPTFRNSIWRNAPNLPFMHQNCGVWDVPKAPSSIREIVRSNIPTLVMSARYDGQTAASFGAYVARTLPNSTVVTIPNVAHVAFASPSPAANRCAQSIVLDFFEVLNEVDTSCTASVPPTEFEISPRRPRLGLRGRLGPCGREGCP